MGKKTKWIIFTIAVMWGMPIVLRSQQTENKQNWAERGIRLREVEIKAKRPMKDIGVQKTVFDSLVLKENIALSMADVLTFNSSIFVKNYGRATLSTVSFRGTSASHTQVTWNGMRINSPMLGMTDFSTIPSYFIDDASLLHGTSSVNMVGGGLGGLVMSVVLREEMYGDNWSPIIPAFFVDYVLSKKGNITAKASITRNYRFPTLNDLYFLPGGNTDLKRESGFTYEAGLSFAVSKDNVYTLSGSASWFDQHVNDWIIWLPNFKGYYSPLNIKEVHAYGIETEADLALRLAKNWKLGVHSTFAWTPSINEGEPMSSADQSLGKQLPYVPEYSATLSGRLSYRSWSLLYKWCYYSERYTMTSNKKTLTGHLPHYLMSNVTLEKGFSLRWADLSLKGTVNNLFNEEYLSVLSRPMPGINFEFFIGITPKWGKKK